MIMKSITRGERTYMIPDIKQLDGEVLDILQSSLETIAKYGVSVIPSVVGNDTLHETVYALSNMRIICSDNSEDGVSAERTLFPSVAYSTHPISPDAFNVSFLCLHVEGIVSKTIHERYCYAEKLDIEDVLLSL